MEPRSIRAIAAFSEVARARADRCAERAAEAARFVDGAEARLRYAYQRFIDLPGYGKRKAGDAQRVKLSRARRSDVGGVSSRV